MPRSRTGSSTIIDSARVICRMVGVYGAYDLQTRTSPEFKIAVDALVLACRAWEALDDFPGQIDNTGPMAPEDGPPVG